MATQNSAKPIHSIIIDTGPLINNTVSISTIINSAEVLYTTPAIIAEIRDAATRSRVETTLLPFLNIKTPSPASYDAVTEFSKKTGDFSVLSRQDLGILALAYEVYCEKEGGSFGLRSVPKGPVKLRPEEQEKADKETAEKAVEEAKKAAILKEDIASEVQQQDNESDAVVKSLQQEIQDSDKPPTADSTGSKPTEGLEEVTRSQQPASEELSTEATEEVLELSEQGGVVIEEAAIDATPQQDGEPAALVDTPEHNDAKKKKKRNSTKVRRARKYAEKQALLNNPISEEQPVQLNPEEVLADVQEEVATTKPSDVSSPAPQDPKQDSAQKKLHPAKARLARRVAEREALANEFSSLPTTIQQPTPPATEDDSSDSGEWITPGNLSKHQMMDTFDAPLRKDEPQLGVATMTTDFAMQNVLLQMNMHLLSPAMQRIRNVRSTILRCHACFLTTREMDKQFCPRCGQPTLQRVSCSTNAKGEFQIHLSTKYQYNKRGDKYSIPKPVGGTSNGKLRGQGGGKGGWGRDLVLSEDQKEYQRKIGDQKRTKAKDPMDEDYLPGILTGDRSKADGRPKVGAGRNVNSRKRV